MAARAIIKTVTIATGDTASGVLDLGSLTLVAIRFPSNFVGTTMTFTDSDTSGGTFDALLKDDGNAYTVTTAASKKSAVDYTKFAGSLFLKLVAGSTQATNDKTITCYLRALA